MTNRLRHAFFPTLLRPLVQGAHKTVAFLGITSLWLLCALYVIAEYTFSDFYLAVIRVVWKPAFPLSWRLLLMTLIVVPVLAGIRLLSLSRALSVRVHHWWCSKPSPHLGELRGYVMLARSDLDALEDDSENSPRAHSLPSRPFLVFLFWLVVLWISLQVLFNFRSQGDIRYLPLIKHASAHPRREGYANQGTHSLTLLAASLMGFIETIFFAAMFSNRGNVIRYWSDSLVQAIHYLGTDNVFVSILESESKDDSPVLLRQLDDRLKAMNVRRRILTQDTAITKPRNMSDEARIRYLSALRNRVLEPLVEMGGYDKVVFSNDVYVEPESIVELLKTADGEYDMACGLDFSTFGLYDLWVIRDKRGGLVGSIWPYFFDQEDYAAMRNETAVPVFTCWNGIVVFGADPVLPVHLRSNRTLSTDPLPYALPATHPAAHDPSLRGPSPALTPPIRFRASAPGECFSSESFLLPYDLRRVFQLQRIYVNPRVIVGYAGPLYLYFKWLLRHPVMRWWVEVVYDGAWLQKRVLVVGDTARVWRFDGVDCHPWL